MAGTVPRSTASTSSSFRGWEVREEWLHIPMPGGQCQHVQLITPEPSDVDVSKTPDEFQAVHLPRKVARKEAIGAANLMSFNLKTCKDAYEIARRGRRGPAFVTESTGASLEALREAVRDEVARADVMLFGPPCTTFSAGMASTARDVADRSFAGSARVHNMWS